MQDKAPPFQSSDKKRIRNASMLAVVGTMGPAPKKQDTDEPADNTNKAGDNDGEYDDNELLVSFRSIKETPKQSINDFWGSPKTSAPSAARRVSGEASGKWAPGPADQQVESELGHRFELLEPSQLAIWIRDPEVREQILTVDVRGRDWVGGHIPLSINLRTSEVVRHPESLLRQTRRNRIHHLVFTCMYSVLRARKCALAVERAQLEEQKEGNAFSRIRISLLQGGMHAWINHFVGVNQVAAQTHPKANPYIDGFDASCWCDGGPSQGGLVHVMDALWSSGGQKALSDALNAVLETLLTKQRENASTDVSAAASAQVSRRGSSDRTAADQGAAE